MTRLAKVGSRAPGFALQATDGSASGPFQVTLDDYLDRWITLLFYPRDFSLICPTELTAISDRIADFQSRGCEVLGISTDDIETHARWIHTPPEQGGLGPITFPLASDTDGATCRQYAVYLEQQNVALRGLFIVDPNGVLQYQLVHSLSVGRSSDEVLRVLDALQSGGLCTGEREVGQPTLDVHSKLVPNRVVGQYRIEEKVGRGACGTVFRAQDTLLQRTVALKVLNPSMDDSVEALLAEARAAAALNHPNVCLVYSVDNSNGVDMIVMEYVDGRPLSNRLEEGALELQMTVSYARQIAKGMAAAHEAGVVHGDLKPANLMISANDRLKIMDFGLARRIEHVTRVDDTTPYPSPSSSGITGTPRYMAPEQARGESATPQTDVYAFGLIVYEMMTGKPAVSGANILEVLRCIEQFEPSDRICDFPEPIQSLLRESLQRETDRRVITMAEIARRLS